MNDIIKIPYCSDTSNGSNMEFLSYTIRKEESNECNKQ